MPTLSFRQLRTLENGCGVHSTPQALLSLPKLWVKKNHSMTQKCNRKSCMKSWLALSQAEGSQSPQPTRHKHTTGFHFPADLQEALENAGNADGIPTKSWRTRGCGSADGLDEGHHHHQRACSAPWSEGAHRDSVFPSLSLGTGSGPKLGKSWGRNLPRNIRPWVRSAHTKRAQ